MDSPDVIDQVPAGGGVNKPSSGTYGEKAELERLKQQLPASEPVQPVSPNQGGPGPVPQRRGAPAPPGAGGLPSGLLAPTKRPDVPAMPSPEPMAPADPFAGAVDHRQRRLLALDMLSTHPDASPDLREWATIVKQKLAGRGAG